MSRKSARPATIATKNQKQTMSLTTMSTEGGMYNKVLEECVKEVVQKFVVCRCMKNESNVKRDVIYVLYILIIMYLDVKRGMIYVLYILIVMYLDP